MFRVVTYNIRSGLGMDGIRSIRRIADVLADLQPDIVCLQEVDQHIPRSWLANQPKFLSTRLGMQAVFQRNITFGVGGYGNCVLAKPVISHCRCHRLPGDGEPRGMLEVEASVDSTELTVFCTHLAYQPDAREVQSHKVEEIVSGVLRPKILCGDMNAPAGSGTISAIMDDPVMQDAAIVTHNQAPTFGTREAGKRIDFVLAEKRFTVQSYTLVETGASDHLPVVVDLEIAA